MGNNTTSVANSDAGSIASSSTSLSNSRGGVFQRLGSGRWSMKSKKKKKKKKNKGKGEENDGESSEDNGSKVSMESGVESKTKLSHTDVHEQQDLNKEGNPSKTTYSQEGDEGALTRNWSGSAISESTSYRDESGSPHITPQEHPCMYMSRAPTPAAAEDDNTPVVKHKSVETVEEVMAKSQTFHDQREDNNCTTKAARCEKETNTPIEALQESEDSPLNKDVIFVVAKYTGCDWKKLAWQLSLEEADVHSIDRNTSNYGAEESTHEVLNKWQQRRSSKATIGALAESLEAIGRPDIADKIKPPNVNSSKILVNSKLSNASSIGLDDIAEKAAVLETVQTNLKEDFRNLEMKGLPWMRNFVLTLQEYYVDLIMKMDDRGQKTSQQLMIEQIFMSTETETKPLRILIEGGPGCGKTTLAAKLAYDWAKGQGYIKHFDLVLLLPLRLFVGNLGDTLARASSVEGIDKEYFLKLVNEESHSMLFILDGYDEASSRTEEEILPLIQKRLYPKSTVIITSRPGKFTSNRDEAGERAFLAGAEVAPSFSRFLNKRVTVKGFNEKQQKMFVDKHMESFTEEQKHNVTLKFAKMVDKEVLTCPLFLLMLIVLFTSDKEVENTETKTGLYKHIFNLVFKRYSVKNIPKMKHESVEGIDVFSCKQDDKPRYVELMSQFSQFALSTLNKSSLVVSKEEIEETYKCDAEILELGFLTQYVSLKGFRECLLYEPVHKSLLEFAAAYGLYLSYEANQCFSSIEEIKRFRPTEMPSLFFPFLVGLMGDNAGSLFKVIHSYAFEYSCKFEQLYPSLLETSLTEPILRQLTPFLPPEWNIYSDPNKQKADENNFFTSSQHEALVSWGVEQRKILQINWDVLQDTCLPTSLVVDTLVLDMHQVEHISNVLDILNKNTQHNLRCNSNNVLHCKHLWCSLSDSVYVEGVSLEGYLDLLQFIDFQFLSFDFFHSYVDTEHDLPQQRNREPLKKLCSAIKTGKLKRVHLHSVNTGMYSDNRMWMHSLNDLIKIDRIRILELHVERLTQEEIDSFLMYAAQSINLRCVALATSLSAADVEKLTFSVSFDKLCNEGRKSWQWVELSAVKVDCSDAIQTTFLVEHLEVTSCWISPAAAKLMLHCNARSVNCAASLLTDTWSHWPCQTSLTELNISVDASQLYRGLSCLTEKLRNIQILALTMTSIHRYSVSLPIEEWISNAIGYLRLKGFEIWRFSKNADLATALVAGLIKCLEEHSSASFSSETHPRHDSLHPLLPSTEKLYMEYLMVNDMEAETGHHAANYLQRLKNCLQHKRLQRLDMVFSAESRFPEYEQTGDIFSKYSIKQAFPRQEGFRVEHDLWGSREGDSIYSKGKHCISRKQRDRISITFKQTFNIRRATAPNLPNWQPTGM